MAYVAPTTRADGYVVDASEWNKNTVDNPIALKALIDALPTAPSRDTACGRLSLTSGTPVTSTDVTAATTLYYALYAGNQIALYTGSSWSLMAISELSIAVPATTNQMYDVFVDYNSGTPALSLTAWTNDTTRATALTKQDGVYVLTGSTGKRYVGSFRTTGVSGQTEDSAAKRYVWNYSNRIGRPLAKLPSGNWNYTTATWRQANGSTANQVEFVVGVAEVPVRLVHQMVAINGTASVRGQIAVGVDTTTAPTTSSLTGLAALDPGYPVALSASYDGIPSIGYHYAAMLEWSTASGTTAWYASANASDQQGGLMGSIVG